MARANVESYVPIKLEQENKLIFLRYDDIYFVTILCWNLTLAVAVLLQRFRRHLVHSPITSFIFSLHVKQLMYSSAYTTAISSPSIILFSFGFRRSSGCLAASPMSSISMVLLMSDRDALCLYTYVLSCSQDL